MDDTERDAALVAKVKEADRSLSDIEAQAWNINDPRRDYTAIAICVLGRLVCGIIAEDLLR